MRSAARSPNAITSAIEPPYLRFKKFAGDRARELNQPFAVAGQFIAALDFLFFARAQISGADLVDLMAEQIELLFARRFRGVERGMLGRERLQLPVMVTIFVQW